MKFSFTELEIKKKSEEKILEYLRRGINKNIVEIDNVYFDLKSLSSVINFDCLNCCKANNRNCCSWYPYPPNKESMDFVSENFEDIFMQSLEDVDDIIKRLGYAQRRGGVATYLRFSRHKDIASSEQYKTFSVFDKGCIFNIERGGVMVCAIHYYCLKNGIDVNTVKPLSCIIFPMDVIDLETDGKRLVFSVLDSSINFSRWRWNKFKACLHKDIRNKVAANEKLYSEHMRLGFDGCFKEEEYKTVLESQESVLRYLFGDEVVRKAIEYMNDFIAREE